MESLRLVLDQSEVPMCRGKVFAGEQDDFAYPAAAIRASLGPRPMLG